MTPKLILMCASLVLSGLALAPSAHADDLPALPIYTGLLANLGAGGYDVVAYHTQGEAVRGARAFTTRWQGADWRFSSQAHLDLFLADPLAYAPQYGGHCAWAMAEGYGAKGDPQVWQIVDGRLYLNVNRAIHARWQADIAGHIARADANYPHALER